MLEDDVYQAQLGFFASANIRRHLGKSWGIGTGIEYDHYAGKFTGTFTLQDGTSASDVSASHHLDYFSIPLYIDKRMGKKKLIHFQLGHLFTFAVNSSSTYYTDFLTNFPVDGFLDARSFNSQIFYAAGAAIPISNRLSIEIMGRSNIGLSDISKNNSNIKTLSYFLSLGAQYDLRKNNTPN